MVYSSPRLELAPLGAAGSAAALGRLVAGSHKLSPSLLKSGLQKAVRLRRPDAAVRFARARSDCYRSNLPAIWPPKPSEVTMLLV